MHFTVAFLIGFVVGIMSSFFAIGVIYAMNEKDKTDCYKKIGRGGSE